jgi:hypothetical protein|tara:strand:+ start:938 stop:1201 length:264 start_codon:yes stop_codon:yes gene_type:complete
MNKIITSRFTSGGIFVFISDEQEKKLVEEVKKLGFKEQLRLVKNVNKSKNIVSVTEPYENGCSGYFTELSDEFIKDNLDKERTNQLK